jgi:hypothetical protein
MRQFKKLRMFLHAEAIESNENAERLQDDEMVAFIRFGNDFTENFYQVEMPLKVTPHGATSAEEIWPEENEIEPPLSFLTALKVLKLQNDIDVTVGLGVGKVIESAVGSSVGCAGSGKRIGGGVTFGPKPKTISLKLNKKERKLALQTLLYNKKNNILVIENLENGITDSKTKSFLNICTSCSIKLDQPVRVVVGEKTLPLKLATQNIKNVELILASNLNTFSLLKAKQILVTPLALNTIKEIYCG